MMFISSPRGTVCLRVILLGNIRRRRCRHPSSSSPLSSSKLAQAPELCHYFVIIEAGATSAGTVSLLCHHRSWRKRRSCVIILSSSKLVQAPELASTSVSGAKQDHITIHHLLEFTPGKSGGDRRTIILCVRFSLTYIRRCDVILFLLYASA